MKRLIYAEWKEKEFESMNLTDFALKLRDSLLALKELGATNMTEAAQKRKDYYDEKVSE